ncbi:hypothetical protein RIF29_02074 [Crotalaria pallida]|uniref:Uncharacterized protein n=1 Tax=Crotalaria pallida TaxID=3830 RepID=A0AAN9IY92_CROPI
MFTHIRLHNAVPLISPPLPPFSLRGYLHSPATYLRHSRSPSPFGSHPPVSLRFSLRFSPSSPATDLRSPATALRHSRSPSPFGSHPPVLPPALRFSPSSPATAIRSPPFSVGSFTSSPPLARLSWKTQMGSRTVAVAPNPVTTATRDSRHRGHEEQRERS